MTRLAYLANMRLPTEKAHGLQIVENCAALADAGAAVTLVVPRRRNTPELAGANPWEHYGVTENFRVVRLPCVDLLPWARGWERLAARLQSTTFTLAVLGWAAVHPRHVFYSRHELPLVLLRTFVPARRLVYEVHQRLTSPLGSLLQRRAVRACGCVLAVTASLADHLGTTRARVLRDGFRASRFERVTTGGDPRARLTDDPAAVIVGYVGRLTTLGMAKGLPALVDAFARLRDPRLHLCVVGGPADEARALGARWQSLGLPSGHLHLAGDVPPADVPSWLAAFDVCAMPFPRTPHFSYDASPLKLFEYMAAGRAILATALPSVEEVVHHGSTAWLVEPDNVDALAQGLSTLCNDAALRARLGAAARDEAAQYTWASRAGRILSAIAAAG